MQPRTEIDAAVTCQAFSHHAPLFARRFFSFLSNSDTHTCTQMPVTGPDSHSGLGRWNSKLYFVVSNFPFLLRELPGYSVRLWASTLEQAEVPTLRRPSVPPCPKPSSSTTPQPQGFSSLSSPRRQIRLNLHISVTAVMLLNPNAKRQI